MHKYIKRFFNKNQFPSLKFCGPQTKPHGIRGLSKHYHIRFDPKLVHDIYLIHHIPCVCAEFTSMLEINWVHGFPPQQQPLYQPVTHCTYWLVIRSLKKWNIITLSYKATTHEAFEDVNQIVFDGISDNVALLVQSGKYGAINTTDTTTMGFYVLEAQTLQDETTCEGKISLADEVVVKVHYLRCL